MADFENTILGLALVIVSAINFLIVFRVVKPLGVHRENEPVENQPVETVESASTRSEPEVADDQTPRTKAGILAWRQRIIREIEQERGSRVIMMIHKRELWTGQGEEPEIGLEDAETVLQQIRNTPDDKPIDLILHTPGGVALAAEMMSMAIKFHPQDVTVIVPFYAMSGGSLMSLAADKIRMERYSMLGPVDPQIPTPDGNMWAAGSLESLVTLKPIQKVSDRMIVMADVARLEIENAIAFVMWLLEERMSKEEARKVAEFFAHGYMSHSTPITLDVVKAMGLDVEEGIPAKVYELFKTFGFVPAS
jgi:ClpP class serine protease